MNGLTPAGRAVFFTLQSVLLCIAVICALYLAGVI